MLEKISEASTMSGFLKSSYPEVFYEKSVLKNFVKVTGKRV